MKSFLLFLAVLCLVLGITTLSEARMTKEQGGTTVRAAAILTSSYVPATVVAMSNWTDACVYVQFTLGSLTSMSVKFEGSNDNATWYPEIAGSLSAGVYTDAFAVHSVFASGNYPWVMKDCLHNFLRISVIGNGTATSSSCTIIVNRVSRF